VRQRRANQEPSARSRIGVGQRRPGLPTISRMGRNANGKHYSNLETKKRRDTRMQKKNILTPQPGCLQKTKNDKKSRWGGLRSSKPRPTFETRGRETGHGSHKLEKNKKKNRRETSRRMANRKPQRKTKEREKKRDGRL